jgi:hypothetical protein
METVPDITIRQPDADRRAAYDLVHAGIVAGLPIPMGIYVYRSRALVLDFAPAERGAVDQWAAHLGLPAPGLVGPTYMTGLLALAAVPGWMVNICCPAGARTESDR